MASAPAVSAHEVAREIDRFVQSILLAIEAELDKALSGEGLSFADARLLISLPRELSTAQEALDSRSKRRLGHLIDRGLVKTRHSSGGEGRAAVATDRGQALLSRLESVRTAALTNLVAGLEPSHQLRLQGAMRLVSDRFVGGDRLLA